MKNSSNEAQSVTIAQEIKPDVTELLGIWKNTNSQTKNIAKVIIEFDNGQLMMQTFGAGSPNLSDWGKAKVQVFTQDTSSPLVGGFTVQYDREFVETSIAANHKQGILVLQAYNTYKDGRKQFNDFSREFFHQ
jgi:hypothetical protein